MAGHRRKRKPGESLQRRRNVERRREEYPKTLAGATTEKERVAAAWNHVRSALAALANRDPRKAETAARQLRSELEDTAERVFKQVLTDLPSEERK